jgi:hypothetical protein
MLKAPHKKVEVEQRREGVLMQRRGQSPKYENSSMN